MFHAFRPTAGLLSAALLLAGCSSFSGDRPETAPEQDETAQFAPVDYMSVCLLENSSVKSPALVDAMEKGFRAAGADVKRLPAGSGADACPFVITYEVESTEGVIRTVVYHTFEHGIPRNNARGRAPEGRGLTVDMVALHSRELLRNLEKIGKQKAAQAQSFREEPAFGEKASEKDAE